MSHALMQLKTESCFLTAHPSQGHVELKHADKEARVRVHLDRD